MNPDYEAGFKAGKKRATKTLLVAAAVGGFFYNKHTIETAFMKAAMRTIDDEKIFMLTQTEFGLNPSCPKDKPYGIDITAEEDGGYINAYSLCTAPRRFNIEMTQRPPGSQ